MSKHTDQLEQAWDNLRELMRQSRMERMAWEINLATLVSLAPKPTPLTDEQRYARYLETGT